MAFRNRTSAFSELRSQAKNQRPYATKKDANSTLPLIGAGGDDPQAIHLETLNVQPKWIRVNDIDMKIRIIGERVEKLGKLHSKNIETFDGNTEDEREIEILTREIALDITKTHNMIKSLGAKEMTSEEVKIKKNIQSAKSANLQAVSLEFKRKQRAYLNKLQRNSNNSFGWGTDEYSDPEDPPGVGFTLAQQNVVSEMGNQVQERDEEIRQIVKSINELSSIVQDISLLVLKQGTLMDQIEYNLDQTEDALVGAVTEINETNSLHKGYRNRLCILMVLVILVIAMVFIAILKAFI